MGRIVDRASTTAAVISASLFFSIGLMVTFEVVMRKAFNAPTIWVDEVARIFQIWAVYLAVPYVLRVRELITVDLAARAVPARLLPLLDTAALLVIAAFAAVAVVYGIEILADSIRLGRASATMLGVPKWVTEGAVPVCFSLLILQCAVELARLARLAVARK